MHWVHNTQLRCTTGLSRQQAKHLMVLKESYAKSILLCKNHPFDLWFPMTKTQYYLQSSYKAVLQQATKPFLSKTTAGFQ